MIFHGFQSGDRVRVITALGGNDGPQLPDGRETGAERGVGPACCRFQIPVFEGGICQGRVAITHVASFPF